MRACVYGETTTVTMRARETLAGRHLFKTENQTQAKAMQFVRACKRDFGDRRPIRRRRLGLASLIVRDAQEENRDIGPVMSESTSNIPDDWRYDQDLLSLV